ncbi:MAG: DNA-directed RNA polymerase subunit beta [Gammaproteobacteria bacterium]
MTEKTDHGKTPETAKKRDFDAEQYRGRTPWQVLGVAKGSPPEVVLGFAAGTTPPRRDIGNAHRKFARRWNPEKYEKADGEIKDLVAGVIKLLDAARDALRETTPFAKPGAKVDVDVAKTRDFNAEHYRGGTPWQVLGIAKNSPPEVVLGFAADENPPRRDISNAHRKFARRWNPEKYEKADGEIKGLVAGVIKLLDEARDALREQIPAVKSSAGADVAKTRDFDAKQYRGKAPWQVLGVEKNAPPEVVLGFAAGATPARRDISNAHRKLARRWNPEKYQQADGEIKGLVAGIIKLLDAARDALREKVPSADPKAKSGKDPLGDEKKESKVDVDTEVPEERDYNYQPEEVVRARTEPPHRRTFGRAQAVKVPPLLRMQKNSYRNFLQLPKAHPVNATDITVEDAHKRVRRGLQNAFESVFPMESGSGVVSLHFDSYQLLAPEYGERECKQRGLTYHSKVHANIQMKVLEKRGGDVRYVKEERVYMGDIPRMTEHASFIINGTERVVVSQMHRSPGVFFDDDKGRATGKYLYNAKVIPYHGRWLDLEFDKKDLLNFRIDRRAKKPVTVLLKAVGYSEEEILRAFFEFETFRLGADAEKITYRLRPDFIRNIHFPFDIKSKNGSVLVPKGQRVKRVDVKKIGESAAEDYPVPASFLTATGRRLARDVVSEDGEVLGGINAEVTDEMLAAFYKAGINEVETLYFNDLDCGPYISKTLEEEARQVQGRHLTCEEARVVIYRLLRPGEPPNREMVNTHMDAIFFSPSTYNLSDVGRMKFNWRIDPSRPTMEYRLMIVKHSGREREKTAALVSSGVCQNEDGARDLLKYVSEFNISRAAHENMKRDDAEAMKAALDAVSEGKIECEVLPQTTLSPADILAVVKKIVDIKNGKDKTDDIDSLANRRIRSVGEFVENYFRQGLIRVERAIRDRLSRADIEGLMPKDLISAKAISGSVSEFFNGNQLSQFMDQTNPLSEITHKRRVSAFGAGGLNRERVGFEVRDVHKTHYGRLCPIETPEGQNIGLINSMSNFADINRYGFIETPYRAVKDGRVTDEIVHLSAINEHGKKIAPAKSPLDSSGRFTEEFVSARCDGEFILASPADIDFQDIAPSQIASVAASLIPFLEHDDANRALMGSNMQRQAVPCVRPQRPFVGTGAEAQIAQDSGTVLLAGRAGEIAFADADFVAIESPGDELGRVDMHDLREHARSNQNTNTNQRPSINVVREGGTVAKGEVIVDGSCSDAGDLALGQNLLVAFMPWNGYNFEDSILISERVVAEDRFSSIHIIEEVAHARSNTQLGDEEITRDIPNRRDTDLEWLDDDGIVRVGVTVKPGDVLVGKVTPKAERQPTPEEKLLRAVFGEKATDVKDSSMRMPPGSEGVVIDVRVYTNSELDERRLKGEGSPATARGILESAVERAVKLAREKSTRPSRDDVKNAMEKEINDALTAAADAAIARVADDVAAPFLDSRNAANAFWGARVRELASKGIKLFVRDYVLSVLRSANEWYVLDREKRVFFAAPDMAKLAAKKADVADKTAEFVGTHGKKFCKAAANMLDWIRRNAGTFYFSETECAEIEKFLLQNARKFAVRQKTGAKRVAEVAAGCIAGKCDKSTGVKSGDKLSRQVLANLAHAEVLKVRVENDDINRRIKSVAADVGMMRESHDADLRAFLKKLRNAPDLQQGILKTVKVYVAIKRNLQAGDKMAGRHGNKGVVSKIVPVESMPHLPDGTPVDIVLSPLGVPSRMNIGQILETHLGFAAKGLGEQLQKMLQAEQQKRAPSVSALRARLSGIYGKKTGKDLSDAEVLEFASKLAKGVHFASPIFDGASEEDIGKMLELADLPASGQTMLYDGHSGEAFDKPITVGYAYMMKLHHLVDEKMHARSTGPYSLVTQQPLGGKAQGGGQRFGEMEVWALEAYGAAYTLCEMLTVKSDDVTWRSKMFEDITEGDFQLRSGTPESFNVLMQEIRAMGMDIDQD